MDLRIINTCNSNCIYCLEQALRKEKKYISKKDVYSALEWENSKNILSFYWWNPLLHPDLVDIIFFAKSIGYKDISLLTNGYSSNLALFQQLKSAWLSSVSLYFHSMSMQIHNLIVWEKNHDLIELLWNIKSLQSIGLLGKIIIHVNRANISSLAKDIKILSQKFWVKKIEFINYYPFSRAYDRYHKVLFYEIADVENYIDEIFQAIKQEQILAQFIKFPRDFFDWHSEYYKPELFFQQISAQDKSRLSEIWYEF